MQLGQFPGSLTYNVAAQLAPDSSIFPVLWSALWLNPGSLLVKMRDQDHPVQSDLSSASVPLMLPILHVCIARYRTSPHGLDLVVSQLTVVLGVIGPRRSY